MSLDTFTQNTFTGKLNQGEGHDGSVFDEASSNLTRALFCSKTGEYKCFEVCCPKLVLVPASRYNCDIK